MVLPSLRLEGARRAGGSAAVGAVADVADAGPVEAGRPEGAALVVPSTQIGWRWIVQGARRRMRGRNSDSQIKFLIRRTSRARVTRRIAVSQMK